MTSNQIDALLELKKLRDAGIINDAEFEQQKKIVLSQDSEGAETAVKSNEEVNTTVLKADHITASVKQESAIQTEEAETNMNESSDDNSNKSLLIIGILFILGIMLIPFIIYLSSNTSEKDNNINSYNSYDDEVEVVEEVVDSDDYYSYYDEPSYSSEPSYDGSYDYNDDNSWN